MAASRTRLAVALALGAATGVGCARSVPVSDTAATTTPAVGDVGDVAAGADTARGVVTLVGNEPMATLVLQPAHGGDSPAETLALGGDSIALRAVVGLEVMVRGRRTTELVRAASPRGAPLFRVERFVVRAHEGVAAHDGVLVARDGGHWLRAADGRERQVAALPPPLRAQVGARVFLVGPLDGPPQAFGIIAPAR